MRAVAPRQWTSGVSCWRRAVPGRGLRHAAFAQVVATGVELLDRAIDATNWPLAQQAAQAQGKRRIALGFFGLAEAIAMLGLAHGSPAAADFAAQVARTMRDAAYRASVRLAAKLGAFPLFDAGAYLDRRAFASTLPQELQEDIRRLGTRNSHLLWLPPDEGEWLRATQDSSFEPSADNDVAPLYRLSLAAAAAPCIDGGVAAR